MKMQSFSKGIAPSPFVSGLNTTCGLHQKFLNKRRSPEFPIEKMMLHRARDRAHLLSTSYSEIAPFSKKRFIRNIAPLLT
jgi:hypothetical protein